VPFQIAKGDITCSGQTVRLSDQPNVDLTNYPKGWTPPTIEAGKECTAIYGTFEKSNDANAEMQFRAFSELLLRTPEGINNASRLKIYQSTSDPDFVITDALNKKGLVESSGIRAACRNGVLLLYPQTLTKPSRDGQTVASHSIRLYNSERFLVIGDSIEQCQKITSGRKESCEKSIHWSRLQRFARVGRNE